MTVLVIGGGAAGMMAALTAAEHGHTVTLLERQSRVGRKLLATGNGRCNLTNRHAARPHYHGEAADFCADALNAFDVDTTLAWFARLGLLTTTEADGRVYPFSNTAGSVLDVLRFALEDSGVTVRTGCAAADLHRQGDTFTLTTETGETFTAQRVILAAGGAAGGKVGGVMDGYRLAKALGHRRTPLYPALVQLRTDPTYPRALKGVKADAAVTIHRRGRVLICHRGEVLFTEYGISGPAVFDISRAVATGGDGLTASLNLLPDMMESDVLAYLRCQQSRSPHREAGALFTGALPSRLGLMVCRSAGFTNRSGGELTEDDLARIASRVRDFSLPITGVCGFDQAQVTAGGLRTDQFRPDTLESLLCPGFYACGEVLDIDGDCGGFNLQWAWSSGHTAGLLL